MPQLRRWRRQNRPSEAPKSREGRSVARLSARLRRTIHPKRSIIKAAAMVDPAIARLAAAERYRAMRQRAREESGLRDEEAKLFARTEVAASPNLQWLNVGHRFDALQRRDATKAFASTPRRLPPLPPKPSAPRQSLDTATCPVCLVDFADETDDTKVRWTNCCGHAYHEACIEKWNHAQRNHNRRCPTCRSVLGGFERPEQLSAPFPLRAARRLVLEPLVTSDT